MQEENATLHVVFVVNIRLTPYLLGRAVKTIVVGREVLVYSRRVTGMLLIPICFQNNRNGKV